MEFNEWYDFYFNNNGKCPECGHWLVPQLGCISWSIVKPKKSCSVYRKTLKGVKSRFIIYKLMKPFRKKRAYRSKFINQNGRKNLDIQDKKTYLKTND